MKICHVIFSSNRLEYLAKTLNSLKKLNYSNAKVDTFLIDDYPKDRHDEIFKKIADKYKISNLILNKENLGITKNWHQFFEKIKNMDYDYILHQEDDVELLEELNIESLIEILQNNKNLRQVQLKRNNWYKHETEEVKAKEDDIVFNNFRYELSNKYFWMMFSLYPFWICKEPILESTGDYPSESSISNYLNKKYNLYTALLKNKNGMPLINHFGEYFKGKRCSENESYYKFFSKIDPNKKYCSRTGILL